MANTKFFLGILTGFVLIGCYLVLLYVDIDDSDIPPNNQLLNTIKKEVEISSINNEEGSEVDDYSDTFKNFNNEINNPNIKIEYLLDNPDIRLYRNLLLPGEAEYLIEFSKNRLTRSGVTEPTYGVTNSYIRTSSSANLGKSTTNVIYNIEKRISNLLNVTIEHLEVFQVVHYSKSQKFDAHYDWFPEDLEAERIRGGNRLYTVLIYLCDVPEKYGGGTSFPKLNITITPEKNMGLFWRNLKEDKITGNSDTLHSGNPLLTDKIEKFALNVWIRTFPIPPELNYLIN